MLKSKARLESIIKDRVGYFIVDNDCPIETAEQFLLEFMQYIGKIKEQAKAAEQAKKQVASEESSVTQETPQEEPKE